MKPTEAYLSFEQCAKDPETLFLHATPAGLRCLAGYLLKLADMAEKESDHIHLMTPAWGGSELSETKMSAQDMQFQHLKAYGWKEIRNENGA